MPIDSILFRAYQGNEKDLLNKLTLFLNTKPKKNIIQMTSWVVGIEVFLLLVFEYRGKPEQPKLPAELPSTIYTG